jgi:hypothetical protein
MYNRSVRYYIERQKQLWIEITILVKKLCNSDA